MIYVLDSCVGFKWLVVEQETDKARKLRDEYRQSIQGCQLVTTDARLLNSLQAQFPFMVSLSAVP
jgi:predicted nucleic acid-binding protein